MFRDQDFHPINGDDTRPGGRDPSGRVVLAGGDAEEAGHLRRLLLDAARAIEAGNFDVAIRCADRAWRLAPSSVPVVLLYAQLLINRREFSGALSRLEDAFRLEPHPDTAVLIVDVHAQQGCWDEAVNWTTAALRRFAVVADGPLARCASRIAAAPESRSRGWIGLAPDLDLIGEARSDNADARCAVTSGDGALIDAFDVVRTGGRPHVFKSSLRPADDGAPTTLHATLGGARLLGSGLAWPPCFALDGRASAENGAIIGWVTCGWHPGHPLALIAEDERGSRVHIDTQPDEESPLRRRFSVDFAGSGLRGTRVSIAAVLPDGSNEDFPDSPLLFDAAVSRFTVRAHEQRVPSSRRMASFRKVVKASRVLKAPPVLARRNVTIVVPVFRGCDETLACLDALRAHASPDVEIIVVDDATPEPALRNALDRLVAAGSITLLRNETNCGFPATANRGLALRPYNDAVLVNADARVFAGWLERMREAAYSAPDVGTVTPLSNRGSVASFPSPDEMDVEIDQASALDQLVARVHSGQTVALPVGVGFCLYLRRDCLDEVGTFDVETFAKGYGEENDFCLRASSFGWRHLLAADVFVHHYGARSFGRRRDALMERNRRLLNLRHPGYDALIDAFVERDPVAPIRRSLNEARLVDLRERFVLLISLALPGGVERYVRERCVRLRRAGLQPLVLRPLDVERKRYELAGDDGLPIRLVYDMPDGRAHLRALLARVALRHVELHHFLGVDARMIQTVLDLGRPYDVYIHDHSWICPRLSLLGGNGRYCGEPLIAACERCIAANGSSLPEAISVAALRHRSARWLSAARRVIVPSDDTAQRLAKYFPTIRPLSRPWERGIVPARATPPRDGVIRIALIGAIGAQKGYQVLLECAADAAARALSLEFVVIGFSEDDERLFATGKVFVTGRYDETEVVDLLRRERPDAVFFPSLTPETWCFTLSHALRSGLPIVAFALGAIAERLRSSAFATLLAPESTAAEINQSLMTIAQVARAPAQSAKTGHTDFTQALRNHKKNGQAETAMMPNEVHDTANLPRGAFNTSAELLTLRQGLYLFSVRSANPARAALAEEKLTLPAVHVGLAPGVSSAGVEFIPWPRVNSCWLCEPGDMIVAKVAEGAVTVLMKSIRAAGEQPLAIDIERLDRSGANSGISHAPAPVAPPSVVPARAGYPLAPLLSAANGGLADGRQAALAPSQQPLAKVPPQPPAPGQGSGIPLEVRVHVRHTGDLSTTDGGWAGRPGDGLWIENFSIRPLDAVLMQMIEYKGLTINGAETAWVDGGLACGTRGMSVPLIAFAIRTKPNLGQAGYDCEYTGRFRSGAVVGPVLNGAPCRSPQSGDPLEGLKVRIVERNPTVAPLTTRQPILGPRFGRLRESAAAADPRDAGGTPIAPATAPAPVVAPTAEGTSAIFDSGPGARSARPAVSDASDAAPIVEVASAASRSALMKRILPFLAQ
ncbi:MAG: glycosyltransferase [Rhodospirillales bacterium]|nr:glycosyltransferase [Rhodospirillales bacterium]